MAQVNAPNPSIGARMFRERKKHRRREREKTFFSLLFQIARDRRFPSFRECRKRPHEEAPFVNKQ